MLLLIDELRCVDERLGCCFSSVVVGNLLWRNSALEIWIHLLNPDFKGAVSPEQVADYNARKATAQPFINTAQFIDKQKHPVLKAINEAAQSLTSPDSIAILV